MTCPLQEALAVDEADGSGDGGSDGLGSAADGDLDDYITQLDAELAAETTSASEGPSPVKGRKGKAAQGAA